MFSWTYDRFQVIDYLQNIYTEPFTFVTKVPEEEVMWQCFGVFRLYVWLSLAGAMLLFVAVFWFFNKISILDESLSITTVLENGVRTLCLQCQFHYVTHLLLFKQKMLHSKKRRVGSNAQFCYSL